MLPPWQLSSMVKCVQPCACMNTTHLGIVLATTPVVRDWLPGWSKHASTSCMPSDCAFDWDL